MRIQILELPRKTVEDEIPYVLIYSEFPSEEARQAYEDQWTGDGFDNNCCGAEFVTDVVELGAPEAPPLKGLWQAAPMDEKSFYEAVLKKYDGLPGYSTGGYTVGR